jgi:hypothetical protein
MAFSTEDGMHLANLPCCVDGDAAGACIQIRP